MEPSLRHHPVQPFRTSEDPSLLEQDLATARHKYDIHGIISVASDVALPEMETARVEKLEEPPSLSVTLGHIPAASPTDDRFRYAELGSRGFAFEVSLGASINVVAGPLLARSPHVLYTNVVEPILRWALVDRGYALVHGACLAAGDRAFIVTARTDTGKTTTALKLLDTGAYAFMADDLSVVRGDGKVFSYLKPLTISRHTLHAVRTNLLTTRERLALTVQSRLHSRTGRRMALSLTQSGIPAATLNAIAQIVIPPPKYHIGRLIPEAPIRHRALLAGLILMKVGDTGREILDQERAIEILLENCEDAYGFPPYDRIESFLLGASSRDLRAAERRIISDAFQGLPATLLHSEHRDWAARIPRVIQATTPSDTDDTEPREKKLTPVERRTWSARPFASSFRPTDLSNEDHPVRAPITGGLARLGRFGLVGLSGLLVNAAALAVLSGVLGVHYLLGALLATQVSSTWNFALADRWVFTGRPQQRSTVSRWALFLGMNSLAYVVRGPVIFGLTAGLGLHYLLSNLVSLIGLTLARFRVADAWIWGHGTSEKEESVAESKPESAA